MNTSGYGRLDDVNAISSLLESYGFIKYKVDDVTSKDDIWMANNIRHRFKKVYIIIRPYLNTATGDIVVYFTCRGDGNIYKGRPLKEKIDDMIKHMMSNIEVFKEMSNVKIKDCIAKHEAKIHTQIFSLLMSLEDFSNKIGGNKLDYF